jgi:hypothetical protein
MVIIERLEWDNSQDGSNIINEDDDLKNHITTYYKGLFGRPKERSITLDSGHRDDIPQVTVEENHILVEEFTVDEVKKAVF